MAYLITDYRTRIRYRLRDSEATYKYANAVIDAWGNAALSEITALIPHIAGYAVIDGDGAAYSFDLSTETRFHMMRRLSLAGASGHVITEHPSGIEYIRAKETGEGIIAGDPQYCVVENQKTLYLDAIIAATDDLDLDYWQTPRTWIETVADATTQSLSPDGLLITGQEELILGMSAIKAGLDIGGEFGDSLVAKFTPLVYGVDWLSRGIMGGYLKRFKDFASTTSHRGNKAQVRYSAMGADPLTEGLLGR